MKAENFKSLQSLIFYIIMKNKFDIAVVGGAVMDITFFTEDGKILDNPKSDPTCVKLMGFEYGAKIKIDEANFTFGGGAQNAAVCFSRLGFKTAALLSIGRDDYGRGIIKNLKANKVDPRFIQIHSSLGTGFSFILTNKMTSEHIAFAYRGANAKLELKLNDFKNISPKWLYITSLNGQWEKNLDIIFKYKKDSDVKVAWNPGGEQLKADYKVLSGYLAQTDILILNKDEAIELKIKMDKNLKGKDMEIKELFMDMLSKMMVITDGVNGAYAYDGKEIYYAPSRKVKAADTTGVGDAFGASFSAGLEIYKGDIRRALELGIINSSSVVKEIGAENGLLYKREIS